MRPPSAQMGISNEFLQLTLEEGVTQFIKVPTHEDGGIW